MKHNVIVKFKPEVTKSEKEALVPEVLALFEELKSIEGINGVRILTNCVDRANRYDLLIEIDMERSALDAYDASAPHQRWKKEYGHLLESKAIFDHE